MRITPVIISGLFRDTRQMGNLTPHKTLAEIESCLKLNPQYGEELKFGEYLWVDWDATCLKWSDNQFLKTVWNVELAEHSTQKYREVVTQ
ncbi:hypothetical protein IPdc08_00090 [archaeon]|nr:hypothetical protein IPdc08_00090 [archaeon]